ncbi:DUF3592 domain-containing protein [Flavobacterium sp. UW10123]|uniref:DUF3592 domain-containing protein n=1 Tax=Flavobacterium sp. UW10123 TaxID=3230800 RepID=UPI0033968133
MKIERFLKRGGCISLFMLPFLIVGLGVFAYTLYCFAKNEQAKKWAKISAHIEQADFDIHSRKGTDVYEILIRYSYEIEGRKYLSNRIYFGYGGSNLEGQEELFFKLKSSRIINIYVNPDKKNEAIIIPGWNDSITFMLIFSLMWNSFFGVFCFAPFFKDLDENSNSKFSYKKMALGVAIIWILGFVILLSDCLHTNIESRIDVIERAKSIDSNTE